MLEARDLMPQTESLLASSSLKISAWSCEPSASLSAEGRLQISTSLLRSSDDTSGMTDLDWRVEQIAVPDMMVGLIIGRGGDVISRLQAKSGARIQLAHDSEGLPDR